MSGLRLNLGCGHKIRPGWTNIDAQELGQEITSDLRTLPLDDNVAIQADAIHVIEHFDWWEAETLLREWHRVLKPGGVLRVEFPDFKKLAAIIKHADLDDLPTVQYLYGGLYGNFPQENPWMTHRWCWLARDIAGLMSHVGFCAIAVAEPAYHKPERDSAVLGVKELGMKEDSEDRVSDVYRDLLERAHVRC